METAGLTACATSFIRRLQLHPRIFDQFLRVMIDYSTDKLDVAGLISQLDTLFQSHNDFLIGYKIFLSPQLRATLTSPQLSEKKKCVATEPDLKILNPSINFMNKVQKRFADEQGVMEAYSDTLRELKQGIISNKEACNAIVEIFGNKNQDLIDEFEFLLLGRKETKKKKKEGKRKNSSCGDEIKQKTLYDLNLSKRIEDEICELDINLALGKKTVESANMLMASLEEKQHQVINIDDYFSAASLGYIRREYKEKGSSVITKLRDDPRSVLPIILKKLKSKEEELIKKWRDIHEKKKYL